MRCLIVDDSASFLVAAERMLTSQGIDVVGLACDSVQAMAELDAVRPDVVLVDVFLGTECGVTLAQRIDAVTRMHGSPVDVILMSTRAREDLLALVRDSPAVDFLKKAELSARTIRTALSSRGAEAP
ncbi:response regulator [Dactylosporangium sp. NPDC000555]|uniref:response regulator n=1 Tax=Dactylosporangium sp. NPDC000555 TaxID=3154260 RepID=UPI00331BF9FD